MASQPRSLIRAADLAALPEHPFRHPLNPRAEIHLRPLSALAGLERLGLSLGRVPPGAESFAYHFHHYAEEFVYILAGRGIAEIGDATFEVGPGDVMMFTAPSEGHHLRNPFETDLVYLMGGESPAFDVGEFPRLEKRAIFEKARGAYVVDVEGLVPFKSRGAP
jgi:uncharacterized cupin superfamily protein